MRSRTLVVVPAVLVCLALGGAALAQGAAKPAATKRFDQQAVLMELWKAPDSTVVGSVNGVKVTKGELLKTMWLWNGPSALQDLLNQKMIQDAAAKANVNLSWSEIQAKINESLQRMGMSSVDQLLNQFKITYYRFMSGTKLSALMEKLVQKQIKLTDAEYAEWIKARHILVKFPADEKDKAKQ